MEDTNQRCIFWKKKKIREKVLSKAQEEVHCAVKLNFSSTRSA